MDTPVSSRHLGLVVDHYVEFVGTYLWAVEIGLIVLLEFIVLALL